MSIREMPDEYFAGRGWKYISRDRAGLVVSVCGPGFPDTAAEWMREEIDAGNTVSTLLPPPAAEESRG